ncbi:MAG: hypothetical protein R2942_18405 [Ignavibacteria bacterium]
MKKAIETSREIVNGEEKCKSYNSVWLRRKQGQDKETSHGRICYGTSQIEKFITSDNPRSEEPMEIIKRFVTLNKSIKLMILKSTGRSTAKRN